jgi:putative hydrolase of the HAD superfamily
VPIKHNIIVSNHGQQIKTGFGKTMITTVVFDLDDTLYDEIDYCRSGFAAVAKALASEHASLSEAMIFEVLWRQFSSGNRNKTFNAALGELNLSAAPETIDKLVSIYRCHKPTITLPPSTKAVLDKFAGKYILALLTDGFLPAQELKVKALGIEHYFKSIVYTEALGRQFWKPSPVGFQRILSELNAKPETCVYIGDNELKDFIAPNQLGIATIRIVRPRGIHKEPASTPDGRAARTITDIAELPKLIESL